MKHSLKAMLNSYQANLGRALVEGEADEFGHAFVKADLEILRRAIDAYFAGNPAFAKLPGLRAVYATLESERQFAATQRVSSPTNNPCEYCGDRVGQIPRLTFQPDGEPILRYGFPCPNCAQGRDRAMGLKTDRAAVGSLPYEAEWRQTEVGDERLGGHGGYACYLRDKYAVLFAAWRAEHPLPQVPGVKARVLA